MTVHLLLGRKEAATPRLAAPCDQGARALPSPAGLPAAAGTSAGVLPLRGGSWAPALCEASADTGSAALCRRVYSFTTACSFMFGSKSINYWFLCSVLNFIVPAATSDGLPRGFERSHSHTTQGDPGEPYTVQESVLVLSLQSGRVAGCRSPNRTEKTLVPSGLDRSVVCEVLLRRAAAVVPPGPRTCGLRGAATFPCLDLSSAEWGRYRLPQGCCEDSEERHMFLTRICAV